MAKKGTIILLLFVLFYNPPIAGFRSLQILAFLSCAYLLFNIRYLSRNINGRKLINQYCIWIGITLYIAFMAYAHGNGLAYLVGNIYWLISVVPACIMLICMINKNGYGTKDIVNFVLLAGCIQGLIAAIAFVSPTIKQTLISSMIRGHVFEEDTYDTEIIFRLYGYSSGLTFGMPILQSFLAMLAIYMAVNTSIKYIVFFPLPAFSAVINARTSIVIFLICGLIILIEKNQKNLRKIIRISGFVLAAIIVIIMALPILEAAAPSTYEWVTTGVGELLNVTTGDFGDGYFSYLFDPQKWIFPNGLDLLTGTGIRVMGNNKYGSATDIGIVNDMWYGGIIYTVLAYVLFFIYNRRLKLIDRKAHNQIRGLGKYHCHSFLALALFLNLKSYIIDIHCLSTLFIFLLVYADLFSKEDYIKAFIGS